MQLFLPHHYAAFDQPKPTLDDPATIAEREKVRQALLQLDDMLWPFIDQSGWDIHRHRQATHYVSSHHFVFLPDGTPIVKYIDGMWLHYGKSRDQLDFLKTLGGYDYRKINDDEYYNAFYLHTRIQFYINSSCFRCWLLLATDKNYYDRSEYLKRLNRSQSDCQKLFQLLTPLFGKGFVYEIDTATLPLQTGLTQDKLIRFVKKDRGGVYSGIVKQYRPDDSALTIDRIQGEMINNLKLLYPVYDFMAWRPPVI
jgi:hypothetical protein